MFDRDRFERDFERARTAHRRIFRAIICFWLVIIVLTGWATYEVVKAGPEGIGHAIGRFFKSVEEGAK